MRAAIRHVRRQFEALRPQRQILLRRSRTARNSTSRRWCATSPTAAPAAPASERVFCAARNAARDLAVAVLVDVSLSTDAWVEDRRVLDVEKEALLALARGLDACGDEHAIFTFTSRRRDLGRVHREGLRRAR